MNPLNPDDWCPARCLVPRSAVGCTSGVNTTLQPSLDSIRCCLPAGHPGPHWATYVEYDGQRNVTKNVTWPNEERRDERE